MLPAYGRSLHIGVNEIDREHYIGSFGRLHGCENDAWFMAEMARFYGFSDVRLLLGRQATADAVLSDIRSAAADLPEGSYFLLTFAGHGSQLLNKDNGELEPYDQTWCLYDRQLIDDELRLKCWPLFRTNTRVLVIIDACHSATSVSLLKEIYDNVRNITSTTARSNKDRVLPPLVALATALVNKRLYRAIRRSLTGKTSAKLPGSVMSISACADDERTPDGCPLGKFTETIRTVWNGGLFSGSHTEFYYAVADAFEKGFGKHPSVCCADTIDEGFLNARAFKI